MNPPIPSVRSGVTAMKVRIPAMLTAIAFLPRWLLTGNKVGHVKLWIRPLPATSRKNGPGSRTAPDVQDLDWVS